MLWWVILCHDSISNLCWKGRFIKKSFGGDKRPVHGENCFICISTWQILNTPYLFIYPIGAGDHRLLGLWGKTFFKEEGRRLLESGLDLTLGRFKCEGCHQCSKGNAVQMYCAPWHRAYRRGFVRLTIIFYCDIISCHVSKIV